ncbi:cytochrome b/b6 domain-containing protein [Methylobacterium sp. BTF04]|uniref:cytochrome b/b6 domain-containing protein n=1 Tax=Methylobacterium sp. BTF04 TaxID=2708300 RepID=UPI0013D73A0E|nr:cytochrome b/b6 domain-containing protein [Methylobacterium sp. BTF04]NEU12904.1 cytochrome b/b6 domain-containing protein [Methylobacterium sp. BTF04]
MDRPITASPVLGGTPPGKPRPLHSGFVRATHWINALAILIMVTSGWRIYDASPLFEAVFFPKGITLGGWLGGALQWHFAGMWLLVGNGLAYVAHGFASGHFRRDFLPLRPREILHDMIAALKFRLPHVAGRYNAVQRLLYVGVLGLGVLVVLSGLAIWKPVQLQLLTAVFGGYEGGRLVHFAAMAGIVGFVVVHLALVALVPKTLPTMIIGRELHLGRAREVKP